MPSPDVHMNWDNLLFLHWPVDAERMRALVPADFEIDTYEGSAWVGLVPFKMANCRFRGVPRLASTTNFLECNVRTYVRARGVPGVWFFSLDAQTLLPVLGGRWLWSLNYVHSDFEVTHEAGVTDYRLKRRRGPWPAAHTHIRWRTGEPLARPTAANALNSDTRGPPADLISFLTDRFWLFTRRFGRVRGGRIAHASWPLRSAELLHLDDSTIRAAGLDVRGEPLVLASEHVAVEGYGLGKVE